MKPPTKPGQKRIRRLTRHGEHRAETLLEKRANCVEKLRQNTTNCVEKLRLASKFCVEKVPKKSTQFASTQILRRLFDANYTLRRFFSTQKTYFVFTTEIKYSQKRQVILPYNASKSQY